MKPVVTWIVLANARAAKVLENRGPGKGLDALDGKLWRAEVAQEHSDEAGLGRSIGGPGRAAVDQGDPQLEADKRFAKNVAHRLAEALAGGELDRLIIVAGPHMLGLLRPCLNDDLRRVLTSEIVKDFSLQPQEVLEARLADIIAL